ncbi:MAG: hypothetical protein IPN97_08960 [Saprospiraceae bacterium]|nr:hypothetical protein [Saprospiraceae bacterium]
MFSTSYIIKFTLIMTVIVSLVLSLLVSGLKGVHTENESVYNKKGILSAVSAQLGKDLNTMSNKEVQEVFSSKIQQKVINMKGDELTAEQIKKLTGVSTAVEIDLGKENKKPVTDRVLPSLRLKMIKIRNIIFFMSEGKVFGMKSGDILQ